MNKYKFLKISPSKKIRYLINKYKKKPYVVFLHGFMSDLEGQKPRKILKFCNSKKIGFLAMEYSGHGKSSGKFTKGNISKWTNEVKISIKRIIKKNKYMNYGLKRKDLQSGKPIIGIAQSGSDLSPCNRHFLSLSKKLRMG